MPSPDVFRQSREAFISQVNAFADVQAIGLEFIDWPAIEVRDLLKGGDAAFVAEGDDSPVGDGPTWELDLWALVYHAEKDGGKTLSDKVSASRVAVVDAFNSDVTLGGIGAGRYAGSRRITDGAGQRILGARELLFKLRFVIPSDEGGLI